MREDAYTDEATQMSPWGREFRSRNGVPDTMEAMQEQQRALLEHRDRAHQQPHAHGDRSEPNSNSRSRTKRKDAKMEAMEAAVRNLQAKMLAERQERIRLERDAGAGAQKAACYKKQLHTAAEALRRHKETAQVKENERHRLQYAFEEAKDRAIRYEEALRVRDARDIGRDEGRREAWQEAERWLGAGAEQVAPLGQSLNHFVPDSHDMPQPHPHQQPNHHMNMNMNMPPQNMGMNMNMNIPPNQNMPPQFPQQQMPPNINIVPPQMGYPGPGPGPGGMDMNHNTAQMTQHQYEQHQIDQQRMEQQFGQQPMQGMQPGLQPGGPFPQQVHPTPRGERDQYFEMRDAAAAQEAQEATLAPIVAYTPMGSVIRADELEEDQRALYATPSQGGPSEAAAYAAAIAAESHAGRMSRKASNYALSAATPSVAPTGPVSVAPLPVAASGLAPGNHGASLAASRPSSRLPSIAPTAPSLAWEKDPSYAASVAPTAAGVGLGINPAQYPLPPSRMTSVPPSVWNQPSAAPSAYAPSQMNPANYPPPPLVMTSAPAPSTQWNGEAHSVQPVVAVQPSPVQVVGAHLNPAQHPLPPSILSSAPHSNVAQTVVSASNSGWPFVQAVPSQVPSFIPATKAVSSTPSAKAPTVAPSLAPVNPANVRLPSSAPSSGGRSAGTAHPARIPPPSVAPSGRQPNARPASSVAPSFRPASMAPSVNPANIRLPSSTATPYPSAGAAPSLAPSVVAAKPPSAAPAAYQASARAPSVAPRAAPRASNGRPASVMEVLDADANKPLPIPTGIQQGRPMSITSGPQKRSSSQPPVIHAHAHQHTGSASFENRYPIFPGSRAEERPGEPEDPHIIDPLEPIDPAQLVYKAK
jgi:hypothetical protein